MSRIAPGCRLQGRSQGCPVRNPGCRRRPRSQSGEQGGDAVGPTRDFAGVPTTLRFISPRSDGSAIATFGQHFTVAGGGRSRRLLHRGRGGGRGVSKSDWTARPSQHPGNSSHLPKRRNQMLAGQSLPNHPGEEKTNPARRPASGAPSDNPSNCIPPTQARWTSTKIPLDVAAETINALRRDRRILLIGRIFIGVL